MLTLHVLFSGRSLVWRKGIKYCWKKRKICHKHMCVWNSTSKQNSFSVHMIHEIRNQIIYDSSDYNLFWKKSRIRQSNFWSFYHNDDDNSSFFESTFSLLFLNSHSIINSKWALWVSSKNSFTNSLHSKILFLWGRQNEPPAVHIPKKCVLLQFNLLTSCGGSLTYHAYMWVQLFYQIKSDLKFLSIPLYFFIIIIIFCDFQKLFHLDDQKK
jgi:hypothetical protein